MRDDHVLDVIHGLRVAGAYLEQDSVLPRGDGDVVEVYEQLHYRSLKGRISNHDKFRNKVTSLNGGDSPGLTRSIEKATCAHHQRRELDQSKHHPILLSIISRHIGRGLSPTQCTMSFATCSARSHESIPEM